MSKPENSFIAGVHKYLPPVNELHREKMANPYRSGTADVWYSSVRDLWVEYKFIQKLPVRVDVPLDLSALQHDWLTGRAREGRNVWVIVGCPDGGVILKSPKYWNETIDLDWFRSKIVTRQQIAAGLLAFLQGRSP